MRAGTNWITLFLISCLTTAATGEQPDLIKVRLQKAKTAYQEVLNKQQAGMLTALEKSAEAARKTGDKKRVDQIGEEREAYEKLGDLPKVVPVAGYLKATKLARLALRSYAAAVKSYTKAKMDGEDAAVQKELQEVLGVRPDLNGKLITLNGRV